MPVEGRGKPLPPALGGWRPGFLPSEKAQVSSRPKPQMQYAVLQCIIEYTQSASPWLSWGALCIKTIKTLTLSGSVSRWETLKISVPRDSQPNHVRMASAKKASQSV